MSFSIVARSDVDSWHAEVEAALSKKSKQFEEEIKKAEEGQGGVFLSVVKKAHRAKSSVFLNRDYDASHDECYRVYPDQT